MAACSKFFGAFTCCCCTCQANHAQHSSHPLQDSDRPSVPIHDHAHKADPDHNEIRIVDKSKGANAKRFNDKRQHHASQPHGKPGGQKSGTDDQFSDYISRAKIKIRTMTMNVGGGNKQNTSNFKEDEQNDTKHGEHTKDAFSDYIKRVKIKIRKTTSIASRKSFKESKQEKQGS